MVSEGNWEFFGCFGKFWEHFGKFGNFGGILGSLGGILMVNEEIGEILWEIWGNIGNFRGMLRKLGNSGGIWGNCGVPERIWSEILDGNLNLVEFQAFGRIWGFWWNLGILGVGGYLGKFQGILDRIFWVFPRILCIFWEFFWFSEFWRNPQIKKKKKIQDPFSPQSSPKIDI